MNIMVFNVPAESLGALSILNNIYSDALEDSKEDCWYFILGKPSLQNTSKVRVLNYPWIKKSWFHRLYFDMLIAPQLVKKYKIDKIISYQNNIIPRTNVPQTLYMHNSIPFSDVKFKFLKEPKLWAYQNIISRLIFKSMKKADYIIVQSSWIKEASITKLKINKNKISVEPPEFKEKNISSFDGHKKSYRTFFYPAGAFKYKNHQIIIDACKLIERNQLLKFKIILTLTGDENKYSLNLKKQVKKFNLPIEFVGELTKEQVFLLYTKTILIFPSSLETFGLPLLEAREHGTPVIASKKPFCEEILAKYDKKKLFKSDDARELSRIIKEVIDRYKI